MSFDKPSTVLLIKLGSIVVHVQEMLSNSGHHFDVAVLDGLVNKDLEIKRWLESFPPALLPEKRSEK